MILLVLDHDKNMPLARRRSNNILAQTIENQDVVHGMHLLMHLADLTSCMLVIDRGGG
jgi:hypothetical protein